MLRKKDDPVSVLGSEEVTGHKQAGAVSTCFTVLLSVQKNCLLRLQIREGSKEEVITDSKF